MQNDPTLRAFSIADLVKGGPVGRSTIYNAIKDGRIRSHKPKGCRRRVIFGPDWLEFLSGGPQNASANDADFARARRPRGRPRKVPIASPADERAPSRNDTANVVNAQSLPEASVRYPQSDISPVLDALPAQ